MFFTIKAPLLLCVFFLLFLSLGLTNTALAGFGISPPYVINENLTPGSHYEAKIVLVRGDPEEDWQTNISFNIPKAEGWISIDKGNQFILPKGEQQVPIFIKVDVPRNAKYGKYKGVLRIETIPVKTASPGLVSIALGGQISVNLDVVKNKIFDFKVRNVKVFDLEEGYRNWLGYHPGQINFAMQIENLGNIKAAPTKVIFNIYDENEKNLLETVETSKIPKIEPFATEWTVAKLPTKLIPGSYWAKYQIFKNDEVANDGKVHLSILPSGTLPHKNNLKFIWIGLAILAVIWIIIGYFILFKKKK